MRSKKYSAKKLQPKMHAPQKPIHGRRLGHRSRRLERRSGRNGKHSKIRGEAKQKNYNNRSFKIFYSRKSGN